MEWSQKGEMIIRRNLEIKYYDFSCKRKKNNCNERMQLQTF
jgi:hypothetical protein